MDQTLSIIKPDATRRNITGSINKIIEENGLRIIAQKRIKLSIAEAEEFYSIHSVTNHSRSLGSPPPAPVGGGRGAGEDVRARGSGRETSD